MMAGDSTYATDVLAWLVVWSGVGLVGRQLLASDTARRAARRRARSAERAAR